MAVAKAWWCSPFDTDAEGRQGPAHISVGNGKRDVLEAADVDAVWRSGKSAVAWVEAEPSGQVRNGESERLPVRVGGARRELVAFARADLCPWRAADGRGTVLRRVEAEREGVVAIVLARTHRRKQDTECEGLQTGRQLHRSVLRHDPDPTRRMCGELRGASDGRRVECRNGTGRQGRCVARGKRPCAPATPLSPPLRAVTGGFASPPCDGFALGASGRSIRQIARRRLRRNSQPASSDITSKKQLERRRMTQKSERARSETVGARLEHGD